MNFIGHVSTALFLLSSPFLNSQTFLASTDDVNASLDVNSTYGILTAKGSAEAKWDMTFDFGNSTVKYGLPSIAFRNISLTRTAAFPTGFGQPFVEITSVVNYAFYWTSLNYSPLTSISAGPGGYVVDYARFNLYSASIRYVGDYTITGPTESVSGKFDYTTGTSSWSYFHGGNLTVAGSSPNYDLSLSDFEFSFYQGVGFSSPVVRETVDDVVIELLRGNAVDGFRFRAPSVEVALTPIPEPAQSSLFFGLFALLSIPMTRRQPRG